MFDGKSFGEEIVGFVREYVDKEVASLKAENEDLKARLKVLEDRPAPEIIKGDPGEPGKDGTPGADGKDGAGIIDAFISREGHLIASLSDGSTKDLGEIVGKDGRDGSDGKDGEPGFGLDDFAIEKGADGRTFVFKFERGEVRHEYEMTFPVPVYCGVFKDGEQYVPGDLVTWGGSLWHCNSETKDKPDSGKEAWSCAVKKGRDGKDAK
jgi:integrin beta 3